MKNSEQSHATASDTWPVEVSPLTVFLLSMEWFRSQEPPAPAAEAAIKSVKSCLKSSGVMMDYPKSCFLCV